MKVDYVAGDNVVCINASWGAAASLVPPGTLLPEQGEVYRCLEVKDRPHKPCDCGSTLWTALDNPLAADVHYCATHFRKAPTVDLQAIIAAGKRVKVTEDA